MFPQISFTVQQTINATDSTYFYCGTPGHCPKGMFGIMYVGQVLPVVLPPISLSPEILPMLPQVVTCRWLA